MRTKVINNEYYYVVDVDSRPDHFFSKLHDWLHIHAPGGWTTSARFVAFKTEKNAIFCTSI